MGQHPASSRSRERSVLRIATRDTRHETRDSENIYNRIMCVHAYRAYIFMCVHWWNCACGRGKTHDMVVTKLYSAFVHKVSPPRKKLHAHSMGTRFRSRTTDGG